MAILKIEARLSGEAPARLERLKLLSESDTEGVFQNALRIYEAVIEAQVKAEPTGGVLYLTTKYPNGSQDEVEIFEQS